MADRPILFSAPMVRAILDGRKTQTRRIVKPQPHHGPVGAMVNLGGREWAMDDGDLSGLWSCPYGVPGDVLWVRETHAIVPASAYRMSEGVQQTVNPADRYEAAVYREGWERSKPGQWRPSIHMPRWACRLRLRITDVRVERLNDCSEADALAEGMTFPEALQWGNNPLDAYARLWDAINGPDAWAANPWVWAVSFERVA